MICLFNLWVYTYNGRGAEVIGQLVRVCSLFLPCGLKGWDSGQQVGRQTPLQANPPYRSLRPSYLFIYGGKVSHWTLNLSSGLEWLASESQEFTSFYSLPLWLQSCALILGFHMGVWHPNPALWACVESTLMTKPSSWWRLVVVWIQMDSADS